MSDNNKTRLRNQSPYSAALTREQFLFYETRTTARLLCGILANLKGNLMQKCMKEIELNILLNNGLNF